MRQASKVVVLAAAGATQVSPSLEEPYSITGIIPYPSQGSVSRPLPGLRPCARLRNLSIYLEISGDYEHVCL